MPTRGEVQAVEAEQDVHLDVEAYLEACLVAMNQECARPEVRHRKKWGELQREAWGEHSK
jgi:hypothetical protein